MGKKDADQNRLPALSIIGPGRVGTAIGAIAARAGYPIVAVGGRHKENAIQAARRMGTQVRACGIAEAAKRADIVLVTYVSRVFELPMKNRWKAGSIL